MVETKIERTPSIEGDKIVIKSDVVETMSKTEFRTTYTQKAMEQEQIVSQIDKLTDELRNYQDIEETPEVLALKEKLETANKLIRRDELRDTIQKFEKKVTIIKDEMKKLNPVAQELAKEK